MICVKNCVIAFNFVDRINSNFAETHDKFQRNALFHSAFMAQWLHSIIWQDFLSFHGRDAFVMIAGNAYFYVVVGFYSAWLHGFHLVDCIYVLHHE